MKTGRAYTGGLFERLRANSRESETYSYAGCPCWEWIGFRDRRGYGKMSIRVDGKPQGHRIHRIAATLILERELDPDAETVEHACGIPWCWHPRHIGLWTRQENSADMRARRLGKPRKVFRPIIDDTFYLDDLAGIMLPHRRATVDDECPF